MMDQRKPIVGQYIGRICGCRMRFRTIAVAAEVRHDDAMAVGGDQRGVPVTHPVHQGAREVAVDQHERPALAQLAIG